MIETLHRLSFAHKLIFHFNFFELDLFLVQNRLNSFRHRFLVYFTFFKLILDKLLFRI